MAVNRLLERIKGKVSEATQTRHGGENSPVIRSGESLVPVDASFLYKGLFLDSEVFVMLDNENYLLFCRNAQMDDSLYSKLERILNGTDHMVYVSEEYAARLAELAAERFVEPDQKEENSDKEIKEEMESEGTESDGPVNFAPYDDKTD